MYTFRLTLKPKLLVIVVVVEATGPVQIFLLGQTWLICCSTKFDLSAECSCWKIVVFKQGYFHEKHVRR